PISSPFPYTTLFRSPDIKITVVASGAAEAAKVLEGVATAGGRIGSITPVAKEADRALSGMGATAKRVFEIFTGVSAANIIGSIRSEEHTSELQSPDH